MMPSIYLGACVAAERPRNTATAPKKSKANESINHRSTLRVCLFASPSQYATFPPSPSPRATLAQPNRRGGCCCWLLLRRGGFRRRVVRTVVQPSSSTAVVFACLRSIDIVYWVGCSGPIESHSVPSGESHSSISRKDTYARVTTPKHKNIYIYTYIYTYLAAPSPPPAPCPLPPAPHPSPSPPRRSRPAEDGGARSLFYVFLGVGGCEWPAGMYTIVYVLGWT